MIVGEDNTLRFLKDSGTFADLTERAVEMLHMVSLSGYKTVDEIAAELHLSESRVKAIANFLMNKSLVDIYADIV